MLYSEDKAIGFQPVFDANSKILILGSFPSVKSRKVDFYYGNPQNRFWKILKNFYGEDFGNGKDDKIRFLLSKGIALWDIVTACEIKGSSDSAIRNYEVADIGKLTRGSNIKSIALNGKKALEIFEKRYGNIDVKYEYLPSTSPANASFDEEKWYEYLRRNA